MTFRVLIRADAAPETGLGHVMRTLAIAESARQRGVAVTFVTSRLGRALVGQRGFHAIGPSEGGWLASCGPDVAVVFDGYAFDEQLVGEASSRARRVGVVDDLGHGRWPVDVLLNQSMLSAPGYDLAPETVQLLGPAHALIRDEFHPYRRVRSPRTPISALVSMGGSDVAELSRPVATTLVGLAAVQRVTVLLGPAAREPAGGGFDIVRAPKDVAATLSRSDVAVSAAGSTTWELLYMGVPTLLIPVAENQYPVAAAVTELGVAPTLDPTALAAELPEAFETLLRRAQPLSEAATELIDGRGRERFVEVLLES